MTRRTILIVDDCEEEREIFSRYIEFVGGRVLEAADGAEGVRVAAEQLPDLILLDISMPLMDGWRAIDLLQRERATAGIPVVALTAHHLDRDELEAAGFCGYLEKPIVPHRVVEEVERCIGRLDAPLSESDTGPAPGTPRQPAVAGERPAPDTAGSPLRR
jgi:two-component system, cell cycle response regulator DivK